jgi:hypothetical protein
MFHSIPSHSLLFCSCSIIFYSILFYSILFYSILILMFHHTLHLRI